MSRQKTYSIAPITVNGIRITQVIIDDHYKAKHSRYMNDALVLELVQELDGRYELPDKIKDDYSYYATLIELNGKQYRLVWLLEKDTIYIGIVNAYRDKRKD